MKFKGLGQEPNYQRDLSMELIFLKGAISFWKNRVRLPTEGCRNYPGMRWGGQANRQN